MKNEIALEQVADVSRALRGYRIAAGAAKALTMARYAALGCAAASLAIGGIRAVKRLRD